MGLEKEIVFGDGEAPTLDVEVRVLDTPTFTSQDDYITLCNFACLIAA